MGEFRNNQLRLEEAVEKRRQEMTDYHSYTEDEMFTMDGVPVLSVLDYWRQECCALVSLQDSIAEFLVSRALGVTKAENIVKWTGYNETSADLKKALGCSTSYISELCSGKKDNPDQEFLEKLTDHFGLLSIEQLLYNDYSGPSDPDYSMDYFNENLYIIFPVHATEQSLMNPIFKRAYEKHCAYFDDCKKHCKSDSMTLEEDFPIEECLADYQAAFSDPEAKVDAAINTLSILTYCIMIFAPLNKLVGMKKNQIGFAVENAMKESARGEKKFKIINEGLDELFDEFGPDVNIIKEMYDDPDLDLYNRYKKSLRILYKQNEWKDLALYYMCIYPIFGGKENNNYSAHSNALAGQILYDKLSAVGNPYIKALKAIFQSTSNKDQTNN